MYVKGPFKTTQVESKIFIRCHVSIDNNSDLTDKVFVNCYLSVSPIPEKADIGILIKQIKSTWNYKNNRMDLIILPPDLQKYFDEEEKEKEL